jgi:hypothetical protein
MFLFSRLFPKPDVVSACVFSLAFSEMGRLISMINAAFYQSSRVQQKWHMFFFAAPKVPTGLTYVALSLHFSGT